MGEMENLKKELKRLQMKHDEANQIKRLKKQIKAEKFANTKTGKVFNKVADIGDAGFKATTKFLSPQQTKQSVKKASKKGAKKIKSNVKSVSDVMKDMDNAVNQFNY